MKRSITNLKPVRKLAYVPDFTFETDLMSNGHFRICGVDEAGRGPLAGPVVAAAVILDPDNIPDGLNDSKKLSEAKRVGLFDLILRSSMVSIASVSAASIDRLNIRAASLQAMTMAVLALEEVPDHCLIDGNVVPNGLPCESQALIKGDARSFSIAAASIVAKVTRDRLMTREEEFYPRYGFAKHKGYPTQSHRDAVEVYGPCPIHRRSFAPVAKAIALRK